MQHAQPAFLSQPNIVRIPTLLKELLDGDLLIPRFQRPFVWQPEQRVLLLDSIYRRYPIGSVLVWRTQKHKLACFDRIGGLRIQRAQRLSEQLAQYVLDGHQRLSTLLSTLGRGLVAARRAAEDPPEDEADETEELDDSNERLSEVYFDLEKSQFTLAGRLTKVPASWLPSSTIFNPYALRDFQTQLDKAQGQAGRKLAQLADDLAEQFKDYALPVTPLVSEDLAWVTESFKRVNSAGTTMSEVHMVHALSWGGDFDLDKRLEASILSFNELGWTGLSQDIFLTTCKLMNKLDPARADPEALKKVLRNDPALLDRVERCLRDAIRFLGELGILGMPVLPYAHQLAALAFVASERGDQIPLELEPALREWFWFTTYTAYLGNNVYLRKAIQVLRAALNDGSSMLPPDADRRIAALKIVHFRATRSRAFALRLAEVSPIDPRYRDENASRTLAEFGGDALVPLLPKRLVNSRHTSPENRVLLNPTSAEAMRRICIDDLKETMATDMRTALLRSHLITADCEQALADHRYSDFLDLRREEINRRERVFVEALGLTFENS